MAEQVNTCSQHQNLPAAGVCSRCDRGLCDECQRFFEGRAYCESCLQLTKKVVAANLNRQNVKSPPAAAKTTPAPVPATPENMVANLIKLIILTVIVVALWRNWPVLKSWVDVHILTRFNLAKSSVTDKVGQLGKMKELMVTPEGQQKDLRFPMIVMKLKAYRRINERYPTVNEFEPWMRDQFASSMVGVLANKVKVDPTKDKWGTQYQYDRPGNGFILRSCGPDRTPHTEDDTIEEAKE